MKAQVKRKCRIYDCLREAAPGSEFCQVKHGWWEPREPKAVKK